MNISVFNLFADYFQFYIQDESADGDLSDSWTEDATAKMLAIAPGTIGIGTVRNMDVPVTIEILDKEPMLDFEQWDHIVQCSIDIPSGKLVVAGCTDYFPDATRITVLPGIYTARIAYGALSSLSEDGFSGDDHYRVQLWLGKTQSVEVLKKHNIQQ